MIWILLILEHSQLIEKKLYPVMTKQNPLWRYSFHRPAILNNSYSSTHIFSAHFYTNIDEAKSSSVGNLMYFYFNNTE